MIAWALFTTFIIGILLLDLLVFHRNAHEVSLREAAAFSVVWISLGLSFAGVIWIWQGSVPAGEYVAGYLIEKTLSIDTIFVFALLLSYFAVPGALQHRVLFWGVIGALAFRAFFVVVGVAVLERFHWSLYLFGAFLVFTGVKMARQQNAHVRPDRNPVLRLLRRRLPMTASYHGQRFFIKEDGVRKATPLLAVLVAVETTDVVFAADSIPAIFSVSRDPFIVYTSNAFAMLGLRSLYFLLSGMMARFSYLKFGLAMILVLGGVKMLLSDLFHVPIWVTVAAIVLIVSSAIRRERMTIPQLRDLVVTHRAVDAEQRTLIASAFAIGDRLLREILVPRTRMFALPAELPAPAAAARLADTGHTRAPVYDTTPDEVVGIVHLVDLVRPGPGTVGERARPATVLLWNSSALGALRRLQADHQQMGIVVDEYGGTEGLVTIEDIVEELVGDLADEFDVGPRPTESQADGSLVVPGQLPVHDLTEHGIELPPGEYATVGGLILEHLGRLPTSGEKVVCGEWQLEVLATGGHLIETVGIRRAAALAEPQSP